MVLELEALELAVGDLALSRNTPTFDSFNLPPDLHDLGVDLVKLLDLSGQLCSAVFVLQVVLLEFYTNLSSFIANCLQAGHQLEIFVDV